MPNPVETPVLEKKEVQTLPQVDPKPEEPKPQASSDDYEPLVTIFRRKSDPKKIGVVGTVPVEEQLDLLLKVGLNVWHERVKPKLSSGLIATPDNMSFDKRHDGWRKRK